MHKRGCERNCSDLSNDTISMRGEQVKKVLILANHAITIYNFRLELVKSLVQDGYEVHLSAPYSELIDEIVKEKCIYHDIELERRKTNPLKDYKLIREYKKLIKEIEPAIIFSYTIKPNIYGAVAAKKSEIPFVANVTGLGSAVESNNLLSKLIIFMYKFAFKNVQTVFFQNEKNMEFFKNRKIAADRAKLLPGSGVNLQHFTSLKYPEDKTVNFVFISRIMKEKGIEDFLSAVKLVRDKYPNTQFHICGFCEETYEDILKEMQETGEVVYHGLVKDIREILKDMHCVVLPSYHEGMSNVLLEGAATARPLIASDIPGCRETMIDGETGYLVKVQNKDDLAQKMIQFVEIPYETKKEMGLKARKYVEERFDRQIVVEAYMDEINS